MSRLKELGMILIQERYDEFQTISLCMFLAITAYILGDSMWLHATHQIVTFLWQCIHVETPSPGILASACISTMQCSSKRVVQPQSHRPSVRHGSCSEASMHHGSWAIQSQLTKPARNLLPDLQVNVRLMTTEGATSTWLGMYCSDVHLPDRVDVQTKKRPRIIPDDLKY
jgi:hypothetical protein